MQGQLTDISIDYLSKKPKIQLVINTNEITYLEELKGLELDIELDKHREKRTLNANAYCWVLCDKIAKKLTVPDAVITKEDVYKDAILNIGTFQPMIVEEKAYYNLKRIWEKQGLGFLIQEVSRKDKCIRINCYYGSSTYNTKEMSLLIDLLVGLATNLNIETKPQAEIDSLLKEWDKK